MHSRLCSSIRFKIRTVLPTRPNNSEHYLKSPSKLQFRATNVLTDGPTRSARTGNSSRSIVSSFIQHPIERGSPFARSVTAHVSQDWNSSSASPEAFAKRGAVPLDVCANTRGGGGAFLFRGCLPVDASDLDRLSTPTGGRPLADKSRPNAF